MRLCRQLAALVAITNQAKETCAQKKQAGGFRNGGGIHNVSCQLEVEGWIVTGEKICHRDRVGAREGDDKVDVWIAEWTREIRRVLIVSK